MQDYNFTDTNEWLNELAIHELRHVVRYKKLNQNLNKFCYVLGGELSLSSINHLNVPN